MLDTCYYLSDREPGIEILRHFPQRKLQSIFPYSVIAVRATTTGAGAGATPIVVSRRKQFSHQRTKTSSLGFIEPVCVSPLSLQPVIVALANGPAGH
jgi:hypothetical protein